MNFCEVREPRKREKLAYALSHPILASGDVLQAATSNAFSGRAWRGKAKVGFENGTKEQRDFVRQTVEREYKDVNHPFVWVDDPAEADILVYIGGTGSWSHLGSNATRINGVTMQFGWLNADVVCHEFGHAAGLIHTHQISGRDFKYDTDVYTVYGNPPNNWDRGKVDTNLVKTHANAPQVWDAGSQMLYRLINRIIYGQPNNDNTYLEGGDSPSPVDIRTLQQVYGKAESDSGCDRLLEIRNRLTSQIQRKRKRRSRINAKLRERGC